MAENNDISRLEFTELDNKLNQFIGGNTYYDFSGDVENELPSFANPEEYELLDDSFSDIDFSQLDGDFKNNVKRVNMMMAARQPKQRIIRKVSVPTDRSLIVEGRTEPSSFQNKDFNFKPKGKITPIGSKNTKDFGVDKKATIVSKNQKSVERIMIPRDRKVIVEGVSDFILTDTRENDAIRNIGYYKGEKLQQLTLIFNNDSPLDFSLELFNPSMPLDYLYSTSQNLNNKIQVAGGDISYSDVLFNILANPIMCPNATITISGAQAVAQRSQPFLITNKFINGVSRINPFNIELQIDNMQVEGNNISFSFENVLNRNYITDGMEIINYKVLAGNTVTICFFYKQLSIKKLFFPEARKTPRMI